MSRTLPLYLLQTRPLKVLQTRPLRASGSRSLPKSPEKGQRAPQTQSARPDTGTAVPVLPVLTAKQPISTQLSPRLQSQEKLSTSLPQPKVQQAQPPKPQQQPIEVQLQKSQPTPAKGSGSEPTTPEPTRYYTYDELIKKPSDIDGSKREYYLSPDQFLQIFGMTKDEYSRLPPWKKATKKQEAQLF